MSCRLGMVCVFLMVISVSLSGWAQAPFPEQMIPIVAHTSGAGDPPTQWVTDVTIFNPTAMTLTVGLMFFPWGANQLPGWDFVFPKAIEIKPGETLLIKDVLATVFEVTGNAKGSLALSCSQLMMPMNPAGGIILVSSRTYNTGGASGTYGQTIPANIVFWNNTTAPAFAVGARNDNEFRSNLGIFNVGLETVVVFYAILDPSGSVVAEGSKTIAPFAGNQWSFADLGVGKVEGCLTVKLWMEADQVSEDLCASPYPNGFAAYVSKVDGNPVGTGDAEYIVALPTEFPVPAWLCLMQ